MTYSEFSESLLEQLSSLLPEDLPVAIRHVKKNNDVDRIAVTLDYGAFKGAPSEGQLSPLIYLEPYYDAWQKGKDMHDLACGISQLFARPAPLFRRQIFECWEKIRSRITFRLVGRKQNESLLPGLVCREFLDLAVTYGILLSDEFCGSGMITVEAGMLDLWQAEEEDLYAAALENARRLKDDTLKPLLDMLPVPVPDCMGAELLVLSNTAGFYGASAMLYTDKLKEAAEKTASDLIILPSSIHEVIVLADNKENIEELGRMVAEINRTEVMPEEVLSDSVYRYERNTGKIVIAGKTV